MSDVYVCVRCNNNKKCYAVNVQGMWCRECWLGHRGLRAKDEGDPVNSPGHYTRLEPQPIEVIEKWRLPFHEAQVIKYISRAGHKDPSKHLEDLKKAEFYLSRRIAQLEKGAGNK